MERKLDIIQDSVRLNPWIKQSIDLFQNEAYLDRILDIYPFDVAAHQRLYYNFRRELISAHNQRNTELLVELLSTPKKFPYEDPVWYLLKNIRDCIEKNPEQIDRVARSLYNMTAEETVIRLEAPPKINTQVGPMFHTWLMSNFDSLPQDEFESSTEGIFILESSE